MKVKDKSVIDLKIFNSVLTNLPEIA